MNSKQKSGKGDSRKSSRRRFLAQGAVLAGLAAVGAAPRVRAQGLGALFDGTKEPGYVPEAEIPKDHILRDPWTGEPLRDPEGNILVDWTGTPQYEKYLEGARQMGGPAYGWRKKDWRLYGYRSPYVTTYRLGTAGTYTPAPSDVKTAFFSMLSPLQDQEGIITPASLHFHDDHGFEIPLVDPRKHRLVIGGMVEHPLEFTMEDLKRLPSVSRIHNVECNSNGTPTHHNRLEPWATPGDIYGELSCSEWTGVLLSTLLDMVGVKKGASWIWAGAADEENHTKSFPLEKAMDDCIIAYAQNGEPLRPEQGFPVRLLTPGWEGTTNIKRLAKIKVTDELGPHLREARIYTVMHSDGKIRWFQFEMQPKSCIIRPSPTHAPERGYNEIRGFAWSGGGKVTRVEVSTDGGRTWKDAEIQGPVHSKALTRFVFPWQWNGEEVMLASRCTDERGSTQPNTAETAKIWGVQPDYFRHPQTGIWRFNVIQPWKVDATGKVTNAILSI
jgi:sulfane dehydrogenase subunit SoxC